MAQTKVKLISDGVIVQGNLHASHGITTAHIGEGSNLYYTDARVGSYLSTNSFATESYVGTQIANLVDSSPSALNTLNELAAALGDDANFSTTVTNSIALKAPLASPSFTGNAAFAGTITAGNGTQTINGDADLTLRNIGLGFVGIDFKSNRTSGNLGGLRYYGTASDSIPAAQLLVETDGQLKYYNGTNGAQSRLTIDSSGNATFAGSLTGTIATFNTGVGNVGLGVYTSGESTTPNVRFGRDGNQYIGFKVTDRVNTIVFRQDEGTGDHSAHLDLWTSTTGNKYFNINENDQNGNLISNWLSIKNGNVGIGQSPYSYSRLSTEGSDNTSSNYSFIAYSENTNAILACRNDGQVTMPSGNVGIGVASPQTKLQTNLTITGSYLAYLDGTSATFDAQANIAVVHNSPSIGSATAAGLVLANNDKSDGAPSPIIAFSAKSASNTYNHTYAAIYGVRTATGADTNWTKGDIVFATGQGTGPNERMRIDSSGYIKTPADKRISVGDWDNSGLTGGACFGFSVQSTSPGLFLKETDQTSRKGFVAMLGGGMYIGGSVNFIALDANNGNRAVTINSSLNVGIGVTSPVPKLHLVYSGGSYGSDSTSGFINQATTGRATQRIRSITDSPAELFFDVNGGVAWDISVRDSASSHVMNFYGRNLTTPGYNAVSGPHQSFYQNGDVTIAGTLTQNSDITLKENIKPLQSQLEIVSKLNPVSYNKIGQNKNEIGFIAQEVEEILPELVLENEEGLKSLAYGNMNAILVKAIQELKAEIEELKTQINS